MASHDVFMFPLFTHQQSVEKSLLDAMDAKYELDKKTNSEVKFR